MNKILSVLTLSAGLMCITSCSDFLDTSSDSNKTQGDAYSSVYFTGQRINSIFGDMINDRAYIQDIPINGVQIPTAS